MLRVIKHHLSLYFMILACLEFALVGACAKILCDETPAIEVVFFRNFIGCICMLYLLWRLRFHKIGGHFWLLIFRGFAGAVSLYLFFYNVSHISLGGAFAFQKTSPIFIAFIAFILFDEKIGFRGSFGIALAFLGVLLVSHPWVHDDAHTGFDVKNTIIGVMSGFFSALALTSARRLRKFYATEQIVFSFLVVGTLMPLLSMLAGHYAPSVYLENLDFLIAPFVIPSAKSWIIIIVMGVLGVLYQLHITKAYGVAKKAGIIAGVGYLDVVFSMFLGLILGDSFPSAMVLAGIGGIIAGGLILVRAKT